MEKLKDADANSRVATAPFGQVLLSQLLSSHQSELIFVAPSQQNLLKKKENRKTVKDRL